MRDKVIKIAKSYLGYTETNNKDDIIIDKYNAIRPKGGYKMNHRDAWCAAFISVVFNEAGLSDIVPPECSCERMIENFKKLGIYQEDGTITPNVGDIIFYNWDSKVQPNNGWSDHVGIVVSVKKGIINVIEGNYSDSVKERAVGLKNGYIRGYGLPKYPTKKKIEEVAKEVIKGLWGNGDKRKKNLTDAGYDYKEVQRVVNKLLKG